MIIQSRFTCTLQLEDQEPIVFAEHEPVIIPARWAVQLLMKCPDKLELVSPVAPGPGLSVTWKEHGAQSQTGVVLVKFEYRQESWVFVLTEGHGQFVLMSDITEVQAAPLFRLAWDAAQRLGGTPEAEGMVADVVTTLCGSDPTDLTQ